MDLKNFKQWFRNFLGLPEEEPTPETPQEELVPVIDETVENNEQTSSVVINNEDDPEKYHQEKFRVTVPSKEDCAYRASKYKKSSNFKKYNPEMYKESVLHGWIQEFFPDDVNKFKKSTRSKMLDYAETCGHPVTKKEMQLQMLNIAGQPSNRLTYGSCYIDNVSTGSSVFIPTKKDSRYLKPVSGSGKNTLYQVEKV